MQAKPSVTFVDLIVLQQEHSTVGADHEIQH